MRRDLHFVEQLTGRMGRGRGMVGPAGARGQRDFASVGAMRADRYDGLVGA